MSGLSDYNINKRRVKPINPFSDQTLEGKSTDNICRSYAEELERVLSNMPSDEV